MGLSKILSWNQVAILGPLFGTVLAVVGLKVLPPLLLAGQCSGTTINTLDCQITISQTGQIKPKVVVLREGTKVKWVPQQSATSFAVQFPPDCIPFFQIKNPWLNANTFTPPAVLSPSDPEVLVCKYTLTINGANMDPHVIVVGGHGGSSVIPPGAN
jgi:hypothetical protein